MLSEHEHVIDCIVWAPTEACRTIDNANYSGGGQNEDNAEEMNGDAADETNQAANSENPTAASETSGAAGGEDESRATTT